jgi:hypothetical protein
MDSTQPPTMAAHDDRGAFVVIGASPYVAYAVHGAPAYLTRAARDPDGTIVLHPVGEPFTRLDLAVDAGRWHADREAHAATAEHECARCGTPIKLRRGLGVDGLHHHRRWAELLPTRPGRDPGGRPRTAKAPTAMSRLSAVPHHLRQTGKSATSSPPTAPIPKPCGRLPR